MPQTQHLRWWSDPRQWLRALLMLDDTPHSIALGAAIGVFISLTPTVGIQMLIVFFVALLTRPFFRFNKMAAVIAVYISNPLTVVPLYWFNYTVGTLYAPSTISRDEFAAIFDFNGFQEWWHAVVTLCVEVGVPLLIGSLIVASLCGIVTYPAMLWLLTRLRADGRQPPDSDAGSSGAPSRQEPLRV
ncbi:MAG: DUF2062 domain-containing protein [Planctomycetaceae bacterium]|nr:DUF2062 domain-containing protein [Planctomycetaceae bacterium]